MSSRSAARAQTSNKRSHALLRRDSAVEDLPHLLGDRSVDLVLADDRSQAFGRLDALGDRTERLDDVV